MRLSWAISISLASHLLLLGALWDAQPVSTGHPLINVDAIGPSESQSTQAFKPVLKPGSMPVQGAFNPETQSEAAPNDPRWEKARVRIEEATEYPRTLQRRGIEGVSEVEFGITSNGAIENATVVHSSGVPEFDQLALAAVARAQPFPELQGVTSRIRIPIRFELRR